MNLKIVSVLLLACLAGCFGTSSPVRYVILTPTSQVLPSGIQYEAAEQVQRKIIGVGPIELPKYLDRDNVVYHTGPTQVAISEFDSWAEPLIDGTQRVLIQNIGNSMDRANFLVVPRQSSQSQDFYVPLFVERFDCDTQRDCFLRLRWSFIRNDEHAVINPILVEFKTRSSSSSANDQAVALSTLLSDAAKVIATALTELKS